MSQHYNSFPVTLSLSFTFPLLFVQNSINPAHQIDIVRQAEQAHLCIFYQNEGVSISIFLPALHSRLLPYHSVPICFLPRSSAEEISFTGRQKRIGRHFKKINCYFLWREKRITVDTHWDLFRIGKCQIFAFFHWYLDF